MYNLVPGTTGISDGNMKISAGILNMRAITSADTATTIVRKICRNFGLIVCKQELKPPMKPTDKCGQRYGLRGARMSSEKHGGSGASYKFKTN